MSKHAIEQLLATLEKRFEANLARHKGLTWKAVQSKLANSPDALRVLAKMESTGGEPDVVSLTQDTTQLCFCDCSAESPAGRRSLCFDAAAWAKRKENKPRANAEEIAAEIGIALLSEDQYRTLQQFGNFDSKTSSWIATPKSVRALGGALFCDRRYGQVFVYHNGADSYYAARGFRGLLRI
jgi:hypothetical protein